MELDGRMSTPVLDTTTSVRDWVAASGMSLERGEGTSVWDAAPIADIVGETDIVGFGVSTNGARELTELAGAVLAHLVEERGFRAFALDESAEVGGAIDRYVHRDETDLSTVLAQLWPHHRSTEVITILDWLRDFATEHPEDSVHVVGLGPSTDGFDGDDWIGYVEPRLSEAALRWREETGNRTLLFSGFTHTAVAAERTVTVSGLSGTHRNAGSHLREQLGRKYVSIGATFHDGMLDLGWGPQRIGPPSDDLVEAFLGAPTSPTLLDLRDVRDRRVQEWLRAPASLGLVGPAFDPANPERARASDGPLATWFDALVHVGEVRPVRLQP
jgi:erythromycin esterase